jgi:hypothetical protein|tara:strand:- start:1262 stop:2032 length:771 start_codon:yes stop_codon:yes gene_type:complete
MDMMHYKNIAHFHEIDNETVEYFETWENIDGYFDRNPNVADNIQLSSDGDIDNIMDNTKVPWVSIPEIPVPWKDIHKEAIHLLETECFTIHRAPGSGGWLSLCMHGMSSVHTNCPEDYDLPDSAEEELSDWTDIAKFCPITKEWMQDEMLYDQFGRVRFMCVLPGGWIMPHSDTDRVAGLGATNVAINNPDGCALVMEEYGTMPFTPGSVFKINTGYVHSVWNRSEEPRIHMIFDGSPSIEFKRKVNENYAKMFNV